VAGRSSYIFSAFVATFLFFLQASRQVRDRAESSSADNRALPGELFAQPTLATD